ncbi:STAS domain-containing protein [Caminibacter pacificus]
MKEVLKEIIEKEADDLIRYWVEEFPEEERDEEARYYEDFLSFFEECVEKDLDIHSPESEALKTFLEKIIEILGEDRFFNFKNSVYTCYLKFPIMKKLEEKKAFEYDIIKKLTIFFEALTSRIIIDLLKKNEQVTMSAMNELEEREAPIAEIWDGVLMLSIVGTLDSNRVLKIIDKILEKLDKREIEHVVVDIGAIHDMNSEVARQIIKLNNAIHFMGSNAYLTGITPAIAKSLTHLDIKLDDIKTFSTTKKAMEHILHGEI